MKNLFSLMLLFLTSMVCAQEFNMEMIQDMKPRNIGPAGMSGRVTAIDVVNDNPDIMYVGTASGGIWKSTSGGIKWEPVFEKEVTGSIGAIAIQQSNPSVIWAGTGEGNPRNSLNGGYGIYKSLDGGKSWKSMGLEKTRHIHRVVIDPTNPDVVYAGAIGSPWGEHPERGVFKTSDGGKTWSKILFVNNKTGIGDLVMDPSNPNKLIAAMWEHKRDPWFFKSGGSGSGLYITHDGGDNWKKVSPDDGFPKGDLGRIGIAIARNKPNVIYALVEAKKNALYRSDDGGSKWEKINDKNDIGNRPFYYSEIYVDSQNENRVFSIFTYVNVSEDGGKNFTQLMPAYQVDNGVHPDHHAWWIHPENGQFMIDGNDGGMNITKDGGKTWRFVGNLPLAQFYHINVDNEYPYNVYGGMQDNGSWRGPAYVWKYQGIRNDYWQEIAFGDGFDVVPDLDNNQFGYAMSQQGFVSRYDWKTGNNYIVRPTPPDETTRLRFNWNAGIGQDPFDNSTVYFGSQFVHKSTDKGLTWKVISPDLTTNDKSKQKQSESGGLTMDATGAENYCTILVIEASPVERDMLWVATDDGRVHYTQNGGNAWTEVTNNIKGLPKGSWIPQIKASKTNRGEALLIANDYRRFNYTPYAYRTKDYGKTWTRIVDENDVESYALSIVEDSANPNLMFLGTDDGLYVSLNAGNKWQKWTAGFPTVSTKDLIIHPREQDLVLGTFGRAAWVLDDIRPLRALANDNTILKKDVALFESPDAYLAAYQQATGSRFGGDALYNGTNREEGAMITYYLKEGEKVKEKEENKEEDAEKSDDKAKKDSIFFKIYDGDRLIRTLGSKTPKKAGFHRIYWELDEKGPDNPSRTISTNTNERGGITVKPGTYKVKVHLGNAIDSTSITVKTDPRIKTSSSSINAVYDAGKKLEAFTQTAADAVKQLAQSKELANKFQKELKEKDKEAYADQIKASKEITKEIDSVMALFIGKEDTRQGLTRNPEITVMRRINTANFYVGTRQTGLTDTETQLVNFAEAELKTALAKTNLFFNEKWKTYKDSIEALNLSPFKETKEFRLN
ncbi:VPS10 domain-containing protein [Flagellimonas spongiicola]